MVPEWISILRCSCSTAAHTADVICRIRTVLDPDYVLLQTRPRSRTTAGAREADQL